MYNSTEAVYGSPWLGACEYLWSLCVLLVALAWEVSRSAETTSCPIYGSLHLLVDHFRSQSNKTKQECRCRQLVLWPDHKTFSAVRIISEERTKGNIFCLINYSILSVTYHTTHSFMNCCTLPGYKWVVTDNP